MCSSECARLTHSKLGPGFEKFSKVFCFWVDGVQNGGWPFFFASFLPSIAFLFFSLKISLVFKLYFNLFGKTLKTTQSWCQRKGFSWPKLRKQVWNNFQYPEKGKLCKRLKNLYSQQRHKSLNNFIKTSAFLRMILKSWKSNFIFISVLDGERNLYFFLSTFV